MLGKVVKLQTRIENIFKVDNFNDFYFKEK